jgi:uncharacterized RDD family membrane protein YckC
MDASERVHQGARKPSEQPKPDSPLGPIPGIWRRMACWTYEGVLLFGITFIPAYLFSSLSQSRHALTHRTALQAFLFVVLGIYFVWFWSKGQTVAMKAWRVRLVALRANTDPAQGPGFSAPSQRRAAWRYLLSWLWFLPPLALSALMGWRGWEAMVVLFGWIACWAIAANFHPQRQFWHDAFAGTALVDAPPAPPKPRA